MKYDKTKQDIVKEKYDLENHPFMQWLKRKDEMRFNVGDVLIKKTFHYSWNPQSHSYDDGQWMVDTHSGRTGGTPKKFVYAFENELGIGYVKQLKINGSGVTNTLICMADVPAATTKFELDPEYADHLLIGDEEFQPGAVYKEQKKLRQEAIKANKKLMVNFKKDPKKFAEWFNNLKAGDSFWLAYDYDNLHACQYEITSVSKSHNKEHVDHSGNRIDLNMIKEWGDKGTEWKYISAKIVKHPHYPAGEKHKFSPRDLTYGMVCASQPRPMSDLLCAPQK